jgi:nucleotide-binding universal stress UspA family protein
MFAVNTILCPTDFEPPSQAAFEVAKSIAGKFGAKIILLHVAMAPPEYDEWASVLPLDEADMAERAERLSSYQREDGGEIERLVLAGNAESVVVREAAHRGCDLIIMGTAGRGGVGRLLLGSVAEHVSRKAPCPVLLVRGEQVSAVEARAAASTASNS